MTVAKPPLIEEIERIAREIQVERDADSIDFPLLKALKFRHTELVTWARSNGWSTMPDDPERSPPAAPAVRAAA